MQFHPRPRSECGQAVKVAFLAWSEVKASFSHPIFGQDKLHSSIIRDVADTPTKSQGVKASIWVWSSGQGQFRTVKILDRGRGWNCIVYSSDRPLQCTDTSLPKWPQIIECEYSQHTPLSMTVLCPQI